MVHVVVAVALSVCPDDRSARFMWVTFGRTYRVTRIVMTLKALVHGTFGHHLSIAVVTDDLARIAGFVDGHRHALDCIGAHGLYVVVGPYHRHVLALQVLCVVGADPARAVQRKRPRSRGVPHAHVVVRLKLAVVVQINSAGHRLVGVARLAQKRTHVCYRVFERIPIYFRSSNFVIWFVGPGGHNIFLLAIQRVTFWLHFTVFVNVNVRNIVKHLRVRRLAVAGLVVILKHGVSHRVVGQLHFHAIAVRASDDRIRKQQLGAKWFVVRVANRVNFMEFITIW